jgi:hypothetical protein
VRGALLLLLLTGCDARQQCARTCEGCCDVAGKCHPGTEPYACGATADCTACEVGQSCVNASCQGPQHGSVMQLSGTNLFVPSSAQGFSYAPGEAPFLIVSNRNRFICRDPSVPPNVDEEVLIVSSPWQNAARLERVNFSADGGVDRAEVSGSMTIKLEGERVMGSVNINTAGLRLMGTIDAPFCGLYLP